MAKVYGSLVVALLLSLTVACTPTLSPLTVTPPPSPTLPALSPAVPTPAFLGEFDCYGLEAGVRAYAGRAELIANGAVTFGDEIGQWTYEAATATFTFTGNTTLGTATYTANDDTLVIQARPDAAIPHADDGRLDCVRAVPGVTGP